jgi:hypothetical protein
MVAPSKARTACDAPARAQRRRNDMPTPDGVHGARRRATPRRRGTAAPFRPRPASAPTEPELAAALRQRLIAYCLMPSEADHWIAIWRRSVGQGDPCSAAFWDQGFRWVITSARGHDRGTPASTLDQDAAITTVHTNRPLRA